MSSFTRFHFPCISAALRRSVLPPAFSGRATRALTPPSAMLRSPAFLPFARPSLFSSGVSATSGTATKGASGALALRLSQPRFGGSLEDYYVHAHLATCIQSPWPFYMWMSWAVLMAFVSIGFLLQSNYYFAGRILPKASGNTQLCEDSW